MPTKILKRTSQPARTIHVLLRELLVYASGWASVAVSSAGIFESPLATGVDGEVSTSQPNRFRSASNPFNIGHLNMWLTVYGSEFVNNGVYRIIGVPSSGEVILEGGIYGASFVDSLNIQFRVVDPTLNAVGTNSYVVRGIAGSATPFWEARILVNAGITDTIAIETSPQGGWSAGWTVPVLNTVSIQADATQTWYVLIDDTHVRMWTQTTAGTGVYRIAYFGGGDSRRPSDDDRFICAFGGTPVLSAGGALSAVNCLDDALVTNVAYSAMTFGDNAAPNMFVSLPASQFDLRHDSARIPIGSAVLGLQEDDRGYIRGFRYISDQIPYRSFVDNGRLILSLGGGLAVEWDGSLPR